MKKISPIIVIASEEGQRLDKWLKSHFSNISKVMIEKLCRTGQLRVDSLRVKPNTRVLENQKIRIPDFVRSESLKIASQPVRIASKWVRELKENIIFEDKHFIIFNKPPGMPVQGGSKLGHFHLDNFLHHFCINGEQVPRLVHRLDKDTSGVLIVARNPKSATMISHVIKQRKISKIYWALVHKVPTNRKGILFNPTSNNKSPINNELEILRRNNNYKGYQLRILDKEEKEAISVYQVLGQLGQKSSWLEIHAITGRKHQIRKHMASIGCPIIGDKRYGKKTNRGFWVNEFAEINTSYEKLYLHARSLEFKHPLTDETIKVTADPPLHMSNKLQFYCNKNF